MEVEFEDDDLERLETDARYGAGLSQPMVKGFRKRMQAIRAAKDKRDLYAVKGNGTERLSGNRKDTYSMKVTGNYRLIFKLVKNKSGEEKVLIMEIVDYHKKSGG